MVGRYTPLSQCRFNSLLAKEDHLLMHPTIFALKRAHQATRQYLEDGLAPYGLTAAQLDVLMALDEPHHLEQRELQKALGISSATLARILTTMEQQELIVRDTSSEDARVKVVSMSNSGIQLLRSIEENKEEAFTEQFFDGFTHTEVAQLTRLLNRIAENMGDTSQNIYR